MTELPCIEKLEVELSKDYNKEKMEQIVPSSLEAFGIRIISRYGNAHELIEMIEFAKIVANDKISQYIKEVFYDSKASLCSIALYPDVQANNPIGQKILKAAKKSISCFELFDYCQYAFQEF